MKVVRRGLFFLLIGLITMTQLPPPARANDLREEDAEVVVAGVAIAGRITHPAQASRGSVLLVPGSLYSDVDGNYPSMNLRPHAYADLAHQLARRGFTVMRMAKIGPGTGSRTLDEGLAQQHLDFSTRVKVAAAGLARLRQSSSQRPCVVAGHSEGALVAALLAAGPAGQGIDGMVSLSGPALPLLSLLRQQLAGMAPPGTVPDLRVADQAIAAVRAGQALPDAAKHDPHAAMLANMPSPAHAYLRSVDRVDPLQAIGQVAQPVLIIQGEQDDSVPAAHAQALQHARRERPTQLRRFPGLTHFYKRAPPGLQPMASMALTDESDPAVASAMAAWMDGLAQPPR